MRRLGWARVVVGLAVGVIAVASCDGGDPGGQGPDAGGQGGAGGGPTPAFGEPPAINLAPGSVCDPSGWCWYNPRPSGYLMVTATGTSDGDIWVGGNQSPALHFDGRTWQAVATGMAFTSQLWSFSPTDVWAVGTAVTRYDGLAFGPVPQAADSAAEMWASSPSDIYLAGAFRADNPGNSVRHFDGQAWSDLPVPGRWVSGSGPDDVWIADFRTLQHYDGVSFSPPVGFGDALITDLAVAARDDVWVVTLRSEPTGARWVIQRFDGTAWAVAYELPSEFSVRTVTAYAPDDVWITGTDLFGGPFVIHWDGLFFEEEVGLPLVWSVERVGSDYFAVGDDGKVFRRTRADSPWREISDGPLVRLHGVWGSAPDDMWVVGDAGTILHHDGREISHFLSTASAPTIPFSPNTPLYDVWGTGRDDAWAVGGQGLVMHWDGRAWVTFRRAAPGFTDLFAVFTAVPGDVWFGGSTPPISRILNGELMVAEVPGLPPDVAIRDLHGTAPDDIWLVAGGFSQEQGRTLTFLSHFDGTAWSPVEPLAIVASEPGWRLWAVAPDDVWLRIGPARLENGGPRPVDGFEYWHFDGYTWTQVLVPLPIPSDIWMFGDDGAFIEFEARPLATFAFSRDDIWAVGEEGRWVRRRTAP